MPIQEILDIKASGDTEKNLAVLLAMHCAPIIKGSKVANMMTVTKEEFIRIRFLLKDTGISCCFLNAGTDRDILYLYREKELKEYLEQEEIKSFLKEFGYEESGIRSMLKRLSGRIHRYHGKEVEFPHEIGIFLGYPLMDVKGFIENEGRNFVYVGYWKVYHNVQEAVRLFQKYDAQREQAVQEIILGKTIQEIAV